MPPKKKPLSSTSVREVCCICCQPVNVSKDEVLFCSGSFQKLIYWHCVSVSVASYESIKEHNCPFLCYGCLNLSNQDQVATLQEEVEELKQEIIQLKKSLFGTQMQIQQQPKAAKSVSVQQTYATVMHGGEPKVSDLGSHSPGKQNGSLASNKSPERKYSLVVYGIAECTKGTSRSVRLESDLNSVASVVAKVDSSIHPQSIRDCTV